MSYAAGRACPDSHLMELADWLVTFADPEVREEIRPLHLGGAGALAAKAVADAEKRRSDPGATAALEADVMGPKGWSALGAFELERFEVTLAGSSATAQQRFHSANFIEMMNG